MLLYLGSFQVPEAPGITVFPDHEDPTKFYCIREVPKISTDAATNNPMLYYTSLKRDARVTNSTMVNLGYMTLTVDIGPSEEEMNAIRAYILDNFGKDIPIFCLLRLLFPEFDKRIKEAPIKLGTISWKEGKAQLELMEGIGDSFKSYGTSETTPSLFGNCHASFSESFGAEGDLLMRSLLNMEGGDPKRSINMGAVARYTLHGFGYIPALKVTIKVDTKKIYKYFNDNGTTLNLGLETTTTQNSSTTTTTTGALTIGEIEEHIRHLTTELKGGIEVTIDDLSGMAGQEVSEWANKIAMGYISAITETVLPNLFAPVEVDKNLKTSSNNGNNNSNEESKDSNKYYVLKTDLNGTETQDITLKLSKSCTMPLTFAPQGTLMLGNLTPEQKSALIREADFADDSFQGFLVQVGTSADFKGDDIYAIEVEMLYQHKNAITGKDRTISNTYQFRTGDETYMFTGTKAKDEKGNYYNSYLVRSRILFKNQDEFFGGGDGWSDYEEFTTDKLTISYGKVGFLRTEITPGNFDEDVVKEAIVHLKYLGADKSDTQGDIHLTPSSGTQIWKCFKYRSTEDRYEYSVKFFYKDGTMFETAPVTETANSLTIIDPFINPISADFYVKMGSSVSSVKVEVLFQDGNYEKKSTHNFTPQEAMEPWHWAIKVRKEAMTSIKYRYIAFYNSDTDPYTSEWMTASAKEETIYIKVKADPNAAPEIEKQEAQLTIDSSMLSWDKWKRVYVILKDDSGKTRTLPLNAEEPIMTVDVVYNVDGANACQCSCQFLPQQGSVIKTPTVECQDIFIIEEPQA